jgi:protein ImuA
MNRTATSEVINRLQQDILALGGVRKPTTIDANQGGLAMFQSHFPHQCFPLGAMHEFRACAPADVAVSAAFITALISNCLPAEAVVCWIGEQPQIYPPALALFQLQPHQVFFIRATSSKNRQYCIEEALRCSSIHAVVAELPQLDFTQSRRFQLAVEKSAVTGFVINAGAKSTAITGCVSRWCVSALPSKISGGMPGVGFPRWKVILEKMRNGKPGKWELEWNNGHFVPVENIAEPITAFQVKTG